MENFRAIAKFNFPRERKRYFRDPRSPKKKITVRAKDRTEARELFIDYIVKNTAIKDRENASRIFDSVYTVTK